VTLGFSGTTYYVLSAGLTGSAFEISQTQGGSPAVPSGAGSGTQTATIVNQLTVCEGGVNLGTLVAPADTTAEPANGFLLGVVGEGPQVSGDTMYFGNAVVSTAGYYNPAVGCF